MAQRTGAASIIRVGKELCRLIAKFQPVLILLFPENAALAAALDAAMAACTALHLLLQETLEIGV